MRTIHTDEITKCIKEMCMQVNVDLSPDVKDALLAGKEKEESTIGKQIRDRPRADGHSVAHSRTRRRKDRRPHPRAVSAKRPGSGQGFENGPSSGRENRESLGNSRKTKGGERVLITS